MEAKYPDFHSEILSLLFQIMLFINVSYTSHFAIDLLFWAWNKNWIWIFI